ncbi:Sugar phosphate permease [Pseudomonas sp. URIL14HWK12:I9]|nr:sugar phosphate permease [Pseudomonas sp. URIL14HWK12:I12]PVZ22744.1 sugar phosphate permease [Pseudomonas sp. URIL14HWK12:I10]PVZ37626.1 sugar phosphate permease [Pseudomonas sp. URIL14HWK12:I11]SNZ15286.1 Sugar phosphate permease [Pseudomonas sp. URIL14HWK12:I9]
MGTLRCVDNTTKKVNKMSQKFSSSADGKPATALADKAFGKVALRLLPLLVLCYFSAFLDRVNVGFAALTMRESIGLSATAFGVGSGIFFIAYFLFEVPSNLMLHRVGARRWIARIMISWGLLSAATAFVWDGTSFLVLRFLLGAAEAGFYPGIIFYLTQWFPDRRRAQIIGILLLSNPLATIVGGPVSGLLLSMGPHHGLADWQWLFIIEAIPALVLGLVVLFKLPDRIDSVKWLSTEEKAAARAALDEDATRREGGASVSAKGFFLHPHVLCLALIFFGISMTNATVNFWLPQMIRGSGFSFTATGFIAAIPYIGAVAALLVWGKRSDRRQERVFHALAPLALAVAGLLITALIGTPVANIAGLTIASIGLFAVLPVFWTLPPRFMVGAAAAGGIAVINSIGNLGGFFGPSSMGYIKDMTGSFSLALLLDVAMLVVSMVTLLAMARLIRGHRPAQQPAAQPGEQ